MNTYTKLKNGDWGIRVVGNKPTEGANIAVTKKSREIKYEKIERILWSKDNTYLCSIKMDSNKKHKNLNQYPRTGCYCGSREGIIQDTNCWQCKHDA